MHPYVLTARLGTYYIDGVTEALRRALRRSQRMQWGGVYAPEPGTLWCAERRQTPFIYHAVSPAIGDCRYAGSGWLAAPRANPEDGLRDLVVIDDVGVLEVLKLAPTVLADSDYLGKEGVFFARAKEIRVEASPGRLEFTVDGEVIGNEPAAFAVIPHAMRIVVGPEYVPEP